METFTPGLVSVVIPARNEEKNVAGIVRGVLAQRFGNMDIEVIVVDDGSDDRTRQEAAGAGATVLSLDNATAGGNPAIARNRGAQACHGDPIIFLDCDCLPAKGWLGELLDHHCGVDAVGGSLELPPGLSVTARCDYYCGWYHVHPKRQRGNVAHHPPCNLSVRRAAFERTGGFNERPPIAYSHEELAWQAELNRTGGKIFFNPAAVVYHYNRPGLGNLLRRNYRWGYGAMESKADLNISRFSILYRYPHLLIAACLPLGILSALYIIILWLQAGKIEVLLMAPIIFCVRLAYAAGMMVGGVRWLSRRGKSHAHRPRWE
ncbi:MAG: glycosyltransferase [Deltaproteobacteria bacterium]|nr:glycosyltransferase [Deltaproteobacteria bacterium]